LAQDISMAVSDIVFLVNSQQISLAPKAAWLLEKL